jgi:hypothetical protein
LFFLKKTQFRPFYNNSETRAKFLLVKNRKKGGRWDLNPSLSGDISRATPFFSLCYLVKSHFKSKRLKAVRVFGIISSGELRWKSQSTAMRVWEELKSMV